MELDGSVECLAYNPAPDHKQLVSISESVDNRGAMIRFWDLGTRAMVGNCPDLNCLAYSPDGKFLAVGVQNRIQIWDTFTGLACQDQLRRGHANTSVTNVSYTADGKRVVSISDDGVVSVWEKPYNSWNWTSKNLVDRSSSKEQNILLQGSILPSLTRTFCLAVSSLDARVAFSLGEKNVTVQPNQATSTSIESIGRVIQLEDQGLGNIRDIVYSPNNKFIAVAHGGTLFDTGFFRRGAIQLWKVRNPTGVVVSPDELLSSRSSFGTYSNHIRLHRVSSQRSAVSVTGSAFDFPTVVNPNHKQTRIVGIDELWSHVSSTQGELSLSETPAGPSRPGSLTGLRDWTGYLSREISIERGGTAQVFKGKWTYIPNFAGCELPAVAVKAIYIPRFNLESRTIKVSSSVMAVDC